MNDDLATIAAQALWMFGEGGMKPGGFVQALFDAIAKADPGNQARLAVAFPIHVEAWRTGALLPAGIAQLRAQAGVLAGPR